MSYDLAAAACSDSAEVEFEINGKATGIVFSILSSAHESRRKFDLRNARAVTERMRKNPARVGEAVYKDPETNIAEKNDEIVLAVTGWFTRQKDGSLTPGITLEGQEVAFSEQALRRVIEEPKYILVRNFLVSAMDDARNFTKSSSAT